MKFIKALLKCETALTVPFFLVAWFLCAIVVSVKSGYDMARMDAADKADLLNMLFGKSE